MKGDILPGASAADGIRVAEIALHPLQPGTSVGGQVGRRTGAIKDRDGMAASKCFLDEIRAQEAGAASDKNSGHPVSESAVRPTRRELPRPPISRLLAADGPWLNATRHYRVLRARPSHGTRMLPAHRASNRSWRTYGF